jgi:hypothetical protein
VSHNCWRKPAPLEHRPLVLARADRADRADRANHSNHANLFRGV